MEDHEEDITEVASRCVFLGGADPPRASPITRSEQMLVLTRKAGQRIDIGDHTTLVVLGVDGGQVRLGFESTEPIWRQEVRQRLAQTQPYNPLLRR